MSVLQCDMTKECAETIAYISEKGFIYCHTHGLRRKAAQYERLRKLRPWELRMLEKGEALPSYKPLLMPRREAQS